MGKTKRLNKVIHPNSRHALELAAKEYHKVKSTKLKDNSKNKLNNIAKKVAWFKDDISANANTAFTAEQIHSIVDRYFHRFDEEIDQIKTKNSIGKRSNGANFSREHAIEFTINNEKTEYQTSGLLIPDLSSSETVNTLRNWNGEPTTLQAIKLKPIKCSK